MPVIKLSYIISFTSEDPKHKAENLLKGNGMWLSNSANSSGSIKIEFQSEKATTIDYIDIGNYNCAMVSIEVGMSSWPSTQNFETLLPTMVLMTPSDCRSGRNSKGVRMFKKADLNKENVCKKWDRIRIICSQPFVKGTQYGLAFIKLYTQETAVDANLVTDEPAEIKNNLMASYIRKSTPQKMPKSLQSLEQNRVGSITTDSPGHSSAFKPINSPLSRAAKLMMASKHIPNEEDGKINNKELEMEALDFLISMNLSKEDIYSLRVCHIRMEFESRRKKKLDAGEKMIFKNIALDFSSERLTKFEREENEVHKKISKYKFKSIGNTSKRDIENSASGLSRNSLALMDSNVSDSSGKRKRNESVQFPGNSPNCHSKNKKFGSSDSDDVKKLYFNNLESSGASGRSLEETSFHENGTSNEKSKAGSPINFVECPLCSDLFSSEVVEEHAANCDSQSSSEQVQPKNVMEECPVCETLVESTDLKTHVEECAERSFS